MLNLKPCAGVSTVSAGQVAFRLGSLACAPKKSRRLLTVVNFFGSFFFQKTKIEVEYEMRIKRHFECFKDKKENDTFEFNLLAFFDYELKYTIQFIYIMRILLAAFLILIISCATPPPPPPPPPPAPIASAVERVRIDSLMDAWHLAAALADEDSFFGAMADDAIYLGTDKTERWEKSVFQDWSAEYFEKESAWDFTAFDRVIYFNEEENLAWFEESLETWMGPCRGSGVLTLKDGEWLIRHYNLTMLIDNDDVHRVLEVINDPLDPTQDE